MRMYILNLLKGKISPEYILYPQDSGSLLYPSVTFCTKYIWQSFPGVSELFEGKGFFPLKVLLQSPFVTSALSEGAGVVEQEQILGL